jgi:hypothetical protein
VFSYFNLGREEDPSFTIKTMVIQTRWPGATQDETLNQVTDRIEKKLEELDSLDYVKSYTAPASPRSTCTCATPPGQGHPGNLVPGAQEDPGHSRAVPQGIQGRPSTTNSVMCSARSTPSPPTA